MKGATELHWYRCSFCKAMATAAVDVRGFYRCSGCFRLMAYQFSEPITTDAQRTRADGGLVFSSVPADPSYRPRKACALRGCGQMPLVSEMVYRPGIGRFCSEAHANAGEAEHAAFLDRLRQLKESDPLLVWHGQKVSHGSL
jgi:hypothetical protein